MKNLTEHQYKEMIYKKASEVKDLSGFEKLISEITEYKHDYGTIVYGCFAAMKAGFNIVNNSKMGGITGFQAGFLGWEAITEFMSIKSPAKILDYNNMLFPQYESSFQKTISRETWEDLQKKAKNKLAENSEQEFKAATSVSSHWESIVNGVVPFGYTVKDK